MAIQAAEKTDLRRSLIRVGTTVPISITVAVDSGAGSAIVTITKQNDPNATPQTWSCSPDTMATGGNRWSVQWPATPGLYMVDIFAYATGAAAQVLFKVTDATGTDRYRKYRVNNGKNRFSPWAMLGVDV